MKSRRPIRPLLSAVLISAEFALPGCGSPLPAEEQVGAIAQACRQPAPEGQSELVGWAAIPRNERNPGPTSGQFIAPALGVTPPFASAQPIPGFSAFLEGRRGTYIGMPDNGFGAKGNSADYVIGFYVVDPQWKTCGDGSTNAGPVARKSFVAFNDRRGLLKNGKGVDLVITADRATYFSGAGAGSDSGVPVDGAIRGGRLLTGYDFDVESMARDKDGTLWVGEEFGPYVLHFDDDGTLLDEPIPHPFLKSPSNPEVLAGKAVATLGGSRGFESLAFDHRTKYLYAVPEAASTDDKLRAIPGDERVVELFEIDPDRRAYTGRTFKYRKEGNAVGNAIVIGDMTNVGPDRFVLIERDFFWGAKAVVKRLYLVDLRVTDADGVLEKRLLADLLDIEDPRDIGGPLAGLPAQKFNMPFDSIECVLQLDEHTLAVTLDTNYPFEDGRIPGTPDNTEMVKIRFDRPIAALAPRR